MSRRRLSQPDLEDSSKTWRLHPDDLEQLAQRVAELVALPTDRQPLVDAAGLARELAVSRAYVYDHADELGARRRGERGRGERLRFDVEEARAAFSRLGCERSDGEQSSTESGATPTPDAPRGRRLPSRLPKAGAVLQPRPRGKAA